MTEAQHVVRLAAIGDIHVTESNAQSLQPLFDGISEHADVLVLCGDVTNRGLPREAEVFASDLLSRCRVPVVGVLGNHDFECGHQEEVTRILSRAGMVMLEDEPCEIHGVGFAGVKGFCGGFDQHALTPFGEPTIKHFVRETVEDVLRLESGLSKLRTKHKIAVLHYAPIRDTVVGEPPEIFPFLGSSRLAEPIDRFGVTAAFHGHAHHGTFEGKTLGKVPVYNVAAQIMQAVRPEQPYFLLELGGREAAPGSSVDQDS